MNNHHHQNPNTLMEVSILDTLLYQLKLPNNTSGLVAITYDNIILKSACPKKTFFNHPRKTDRRSNAKSFSFLVILVRIASASSPPPPPSAMDVVSVKLLLSSEVEEVSSAPVSEANSVRRLYRSRSRLTTYIQRERESKFCFRCPANQSNYLSHIDD